MASFKIWLAKSQLGDLRIDERDRRGLPAEDDLRVVAVYAEMLEDVLGLDPRMEVSLTQEAYQIARGQLRHGSKVPWTRNKWVPLFASNDSFKYPKWAIVGQTMVTCRNGHNIRITHRQVLREAKKARNQGLDEVYL